MEQFITALYNLAETCKYGALRDEMLHDRIVVGIADSSPLERLQMIKDQTLEKAKTLFRQREAVHEQQLIQLKGQIKSEPHLDAFQHYPPSKGKSPTTGKTVGQSASQHQSQHAVVSRVKNRQRVRDVGVGATLDSSIRHGMQNATSATNGDIMDNCAELSPSLRTQNYWTTLPT